MYVAKEVLLALADSSVHELAKRTLSMLGIDVDITPDSAAAAALLREKDYSVVVVDGTSEEVLQTLAELPRPRPIVIVTTDDPDDALDPQVVVVPPPHDPQMLVGVIVACANDQLQSEQGAQ